MRLVPRHLFPAAFLLASLSPLRAQAAARASFEATEHDFGEVRRGAKVSWSLHVRNTGDETLEFTGARFSLSGMTARLPGKVAAGAEGTIAIDWITDRVQGSVRGTAAVETNDPSARTVTLILKARVHGPLDVEPIPQVFLSTFQGEGVRRELTLRSNQPGPVTLRVSSPPSERTIAELATIEPGRAWRLTVRAAPKATPGRWDEEVRLESNDPEIGTFRIPVHVFVKADLYANPDDLDFGEVSISRLEGQAGIASLVQQYFLVRKREGKFELRSVRSSVPAFQPRVTPSSGGREAFRVDVGFKPSGLEPGSLDGAITLETDDPKFPRLVVKTRGRLVP